MRRLKWTADAEKRLIEAWNAGVGPTDLARSLRDQPWRDQ